MVENFKCANFMSNSVTPSIDEIVQHLPQQAHQQQYTILENTHWLQGNPVPVSSGLCACVSRGCPSWALHQPSCSLELFLGSFDIKKP